MVKKMTNQITWF